MKKLVINMKNVLVQEGELEAVGTGFVVIKVISEGLVILDVSLIIEFWMIKSKFKRV